MGRVLTLVLISCGIGATSGRPEHSQFAGRPEHSQPALSSDRSILKTVDEVRRFKSDELGEEHRAHLRAVVTYYDSMTPNLFVHDATGDLWVDLGGVNEAPPRLGQFLDISGVVGVGSSPYLASPVWKVLGSAPLPKPVPLSYEQAATGAFDGQYSEMEGIVRSFARVAQGNVLVLEVATPTGTFEAMVPNYQAGSPTQLVDAKVQFTGVCSTAFNHGKQPNEIHMMVPVLANAKVIQPATSDPSAMAITSLNQIGRLLAQSPDIHRVKVRGVITARFPGQGLFLRDSTGGVYLESRDGSQAEAGDEVEAIGFPASGVYTPKLESADIRPTGRHQTIAPAKIDGKTALEGGYDARLVTISGTVQSVNLVPGSYTLILQSEDHVNFAARFANVSSLPSIPAKESKLSLTGICSIKMDRNGHPAAFEIVLRSPADVLLLSSPPWLTNQRAAIIFSAVALITAMVIGWIIILRRQVRNQTEIIKVRLENEAALEERYRQMFQRNLTGLYIATSDGHIVDCNVTCARILGYSDRTAMLGDRSNVELVTAQFHEQLYSGRSRGENQILNTEYRFQCPDGTWKWVLANVRGTEPTENASAMIEGGLVDITDRKAAEDRVQYLAYYDSLTGLPNRSLLRDRLGNALAAARRHKEKLAVLYLDLNRFKIINDSLGHSIGDLLLIEVAKRLKELSREEDTVARIGGDEFLLVLPSILESSDAAVTAERIAVGMAKEFLVQGHSFKVSCSIGISIFPEHGEDGETLIKHADAAMYSAKGSGRHAFRFFTEEMSAQVVERLTIEHDLRVALEKEELFLVYQPQLGLATGKITGFEALLRWEHPEMGLVPPGRFISVAESSGLIVPIGEWVLRTACAQASRWLDAGLRVPSIAVNVSAIQFRQEGFCELVKAVLHDTALPPRYLELEITESLLMSSGDSIFSLLAELKGMGVNLAIDDFGTGYSSLSYLRQFPVSKLKIDGAFIKDVATNPDDAAIATAMIQMSKALNLKVIAECVETKAQMEFLQSGRCDEIQGYYFSKPLSAGDAERLMLLDQSEIEAERTSCTRFFARPIESLVGGA